MASSIARVGSVALTDLKTDLTNLSKTLHQIYDLMNADMRQVNAAWQDGKYEEFVQGYKPQIDKCEEISIRYGEWCTRVLEPTIDNVIAVEMTEVGGSGGSAGGVSPAGVVGGGMAAAGAVGVARGFNMGANQGPKPTTKAVPISNMTAPSTDKYKDAFKEKEIYFVDKNGNVKANRDKLISAINDVHGNNPQVKYENLDENQYGKQHGNNSITLNEKLEKDGFKFVNTYAHESQHIDQKEFCRIKENSQDAMCDNIKHYKEPCKAEEWKKDKKGCDVKYSEYKGQIVEVNAREAGANAQKAAEEYLHDFKIEHKLEKPRAYKI